MDLRMVKLGVNVNIQRSDGRVHLAAITSIDLERRVLAVEWYEGGETKGKEIDCDLIMQLNPELRKPLSSRSVNSRSTNKERSASASSKRKDDRRTICTPAKEQPGAPDQVHPTPQMPPSRNGLRSQSMISRTPAQEELPPSRPSAVKKDNKSRIAKPTQPSRMEKEEMPPPAVPSEERLRQAIGAPLVKEPAAKDISLVAGKRKSSCVKEVEKMQKKREERRAKNREQQMARIQDYDPSHPNWEFLKMITEYRSQLQIVPLSVDEEVEEHRICVCVRKRPINAKERTKREVDVITIPDSATTVIHEPKTKVDLTKYLENHQFRFDYSFDDSATNEMVYKFTAKPLVATIFERGMATCFAYGQTGSGKTHTMGGTFTGKDQDASKGIYAMVTTDMFRLLRSAKHRSKDLIVCASFFEIYCGKVFDLLNGQKRLKVWEDGKQQVQVVGLTETHVRGVEEVLELISVGNKARTSGTTSANQHSSRSHAVFQIILRTRSTKKLHGKFSLIDLAGNERGADTSTSDRQTRMEGAEINKSLLALKECIRALGRKGSHLPFRGSVLTQVLKDSFVGDNSRTCMIAMVSPGFNCCEHTLNTLRYADRVKELGPGGNGKQAPRPAKSSQPQPPADEDSLYQEEEEEEEEVVVGAGLSPANSDLRILHRSLRREARANGSASEELLTFHEAVLNLREAEDALVEHHKEVVEESEHWLATDRQLVALAEGTESNTDEYVKGLKSILEEKQAKIAGLLKRLEVFQQRLADEEVASKKVKRLPFV